MATLKQALELIAASQGKIISVLFIKKNNEERRMTCRVGGVAKGINGKKLPYDPYERGLFPAFDMKLGEWRMVNVMTLREVKALGRRLEVNGEEE